MRACFGVLGFGGIDQAQKFVDFEAVRDLAEEAFQLGGGFREMACVVLGNGGLEFFVEQLGGRLGLAGGEKGEGYK
jgi:hypothetical protein